VKLSFAVCGISLGVRCPNSLRDKVEALVSPFLERGVATFDLSLRHTPFTDRARISAREWKAEEAQEAQNEIISRLFWKGTSLDCSLRSEAIWAISAALGLLLARALSDNDGLLLHGALLLKHGCAYGFLGPSGSGKSTLAGNSKHAICIHDDRVVVRRLKQGWYASGSPLCRNNHRPGRNTSVPLRGLFLLEKGKGLHCRTLRRSMAPGLLSPNVIIPETNLAMRKRCGETLLRLAAEVPVSSLVFGPKADVSIIL
jgi:hypothetical protein